MSCCTRSSVIKNILSTLLKNYYNNRKNNFVLKKDFYKVLQQLIISNVKLNTDNINDINDITKIFEDLGLVFNNDFQFPEFDYETICLQIYSIKPKYVVKKNIDNILKKYKLKKDYVKDDETNIKITKLIIDMKINCRTALNHYTDNNEKNLKNKRNLINKEIIILFVYSGSLKYWLDIIKSNKYIEYINKYAECYTPFYNEFGKFKKIIGDFRNVRIINDFDKISKLISKFINYLSKSITKNMDRDMILSLAYDVKELFDSRMPKIQKELHNSILKKNKIILLDLTKAYDTVDKRLLDLVIRLYYPEYIVNFINYQMFTIKEKNTDRNKDNGIAQGHPLSTLLFHLVHNIICQYIKQQITDIDIKIFVDDIIIYYDKEIPNDVIASNNKIIQDIYSKFGLKINPNKTLSINIDSNKWKGEYYLGVPMSNKYQDVRKCLDDRYGKELLDILDKAIRNNINLNKYQIFKNSLRLSLAYRLKFIKEFDSKEEKQQFIIDMKNDNLALYNIYNECKNYIFVYEEEMDELDKNTIDNITDKIRINIAQTDISGNDIYTCI